LKTVIIPRFLETKGDKYFIPRYVKIVRGEEVEWVNQDTQPHRLSFYRVEGQNASPLFDFETIQPESSISKKFDFDLTRIDYICLNHHEVGSVVIFPEDEESMTNSQRLKFLSKVFDIKPPGP